MVQENTLRKELPKVQLYHLIYDKHEHFFHIEFFCIVVKSNMTIKSENV